MYPLTHPQPATIEVQLPEAEWGNMVFCPAFFTNQWVIVGNLLSKDTARGARLLVGTASPFTRVNRQIACCLFLSSAPRNPLGSWSDPEVLLCLPGNLSKLPFLLQPSTMPPPTALEGLSPSFGGSLSWGGGGQEDAIGRKTG